MMFDKRRKRGSVTDLFIFIIVFWILLFICFGTFGSYLGTPSVSQDCTDASCDITEIGLSEAEQVGGFDFFSNMLLVFKVMFWSVPESYGIPAWVSLLFDMIGILSLFVVVMWARGVS